MTKEHKNAILKMFPGAADKTYTVKEYAYGDDANGDYNMDISDPYGFPKMCTRHALGKSRMLWTENNEA